MNPIEMTLIRNYPIHSTDRTMHYSKKGRNTMTEWVPFIKESNQKTLRIIAFKNNRKFNENKN